MNALHENYGFGFHFEFAVNLLELFTKNLQFEFKLNLCSFIQGLVFVRVRAKVRPAT